MVVFLCRVPESIKGQSVFVVVAVGSIFRYVDAVTTLALGGRGSGDSFCFRDVALLPVVTTRVKYSYVCTGNVLTVKPQQNVRGENGVYGNGHD